MSKKGDIAIYLSKDGQTSLEVNLQEETVWLTQKQMGELFDKDTDTVGLHIKNIYQSDELEEKATTDKSSVVQQEGNRKVKRQISFYNLDVIISVGYRVNSKQGVQFRIWATKVLRDHLVKGYTLNEKRLKEQAQKYKELQQSVKLLENVISQKDLTADEASGLLKVITDYTYALDILDQYDHQSLETTNTNEDEIFRLTYEEAIKAIQGLKDKFGSGDLFGNEKDASFDSSINTIYQTFGGIDLYPSIEEKAANLLYFVVKNHSFSDGNKRIAAFLFVWFMDKNNHLYTYDGAKRIADNALVAITLMIAESKAEEKDMMVKVIVNLINGNN